MAIADPVVLQPPRHRRPRWWGTSKMKGVIYMSDDTLSSKLERIHVLAELLLDLLVGIPQAQVLTEIIIETSIP